MTSEQMSKYIWGILQTQLPVVWSWGIDLQTVKVIELGINFHVQGFRHNGYVEVSYDEASDTFTVCLISNSGERAKTIEGVYLDDLVSTIDENVEKTPDYEKRVMQGILIL